MTRRCSPNADSLLRQTVQDAKKTLNDAATGRAIARVDCSKSGVRNTRRTEGASLTQTEVDLIQDPFFRLVEIWEGEAPTEPFFTLPTKTARRELRPGLLNNPDF